jgi:A/G-specific adenine glycosylase
MCEVPGTEWTASRPAVSAAPFEAAWTAVPSEVEHVFTHFALHLSVEKAEIRANMPAPSHHWWAPPQSLPDEALPSVMRKVIEAAYPAATKRHREPA